MMNVKCIGMSGSIKQKIYSAIRYDEE